MSLDKEIFNDHIEHGTTDDTRNEFVFHSNEEFINFQKCFTDIVWSNQVVQLGANCGSDDDDPKFYPSTECDHVKFTFMNIGKQHYQIINNRAFYFQGYKSILIQGGRSQRSHHCDVPVLEVFNECGAGKTPFYDLEGNAYHSYINDDAIFNIQNTTDTQVDVVISDIEFLVAFNLEDVEAARMFKQWYDPRICPVLFKVYEASSFKMFNVRMYSQFLDFTHVFIHWCENVEITNCKFENYNARKVGGNLWLCQRVKNVKIVDNDFYKYGNDENIGIWGDSLVSRDENNCYDFRNTLLGLNDEKYANRHLEFEHIHIKNNRFFYGKPEHPYGSTTDAFPNQVSLSGIHAAQLAPENRFGAQDTEEVWDGVMDIFQTLFFSQHTPKPIPAIDRTEQANLANTNGETTFSDLGTEVVDDSEVDYGFDEIQLDNYFIVPYVHYNVSDFVVDANEYYIDSPMKTLMGMTFDNFCNTEGIKITNNLIKYGPWAHGQCQLQDFKIVYDKNPDWDPTSQQLEGSNKTCLDPVLIEGNTIDCKALAYFEYRPTSNNGSTSNPTIGHIEVPLVPYRVEEHFILDIENAAVTMNNNVVNCYIEPGNEETDFATTSLNIDDLGFMLLYSREKGGRVTMNNNIFRGMKNMGSFRMPTDNTFSRIELIANNNVFQGTTVFFNEYMKDGVFKFTNNLFIAEHSILLLQEMPLSTLLVIQNNVFKRQSENAAVANLYFSNYNKDKDTTPPPSPTPYQYDRHFVGK